MTNPRVTVLMAVYNAQAFLRVAIESVLCQTFDDFELRIAYAPSNDASYQIIDEYQDPRICVVPAAGPGRVSLARNAALMSALGEYVAVLDADDVAHPDRLETQVVFLDRHPEIDLVGSAFHIIDERGKITGTQTVPVDSLANQWGLLFGNVIGHSTVMYRRGRAIQLGGYDDKVLAGEDYDLWVRFIGQSAIAQISQPLVRWRRHGGSLSHTEPAEVEDHFILTVAQSIRQQTQQSVSFEVARTLFRNIAVPAPDANVLRQAYHVLENCLSSFQNRPPTVPHQRELVTTLALDDLFRLARLNPHSYPYAYRLAMSWARENLHYQPFITRLAKRAGASVLPVPVVDLLRGISRGHLTVEAQPTTRHRV